MFYSLPPLPHECTCATVHRVRRQHGRLGSLVSWGLNSGPQVWGQRPLPTEPSPWLQAYISIFKYVAIACNPERPPGTEPSGFLYLLCVIHFLRLPDPQILMALESDVYPCSGSNLFDLCPLPCCAMFLLPQGLCTCCPGVYSHLSPEAVGFRASFYL